MSSIEEYTEQMTSDPFNFIKNITLTANDYIELSKTVAGISLITTVLRYRTTSVLLQAKEDIELYKAIQSITHLIDNEKLPLDIHVAATYWNKDDDFQPYPVKGNDLTFEITHSLVRPKEVLEINRHFLNIDTLKNIDIYDDNDEELKALTHFLVVMNIYSFDSKEIVFNALISSQNVNLIDLFSQFYPEEFAFHLWAFPCQLDYLKKVISDKSSLWIFLKKYKEKALIEYEQLQLKKLIEDF